MKIDRIVVVKKCGEIKVIIINNCWKWNLRNLVMGHIPNKPI